MQVIFCVFLCVGFASGGFIDNIRCFFGGNCEPEPEPEWNGLRVKFGLNPFTNFKHQPRTVEEALSEGWTKISDCDVTAQWRGNRYVKDDDFSVILLFDVKGYIAGVQTSFLDNQASGLPTALDRPPFVQDGDRFLDNQASGFPAALDRPPFVQDGDRVTLSAYFVDPSIICTTGRNASQFSTQGTGTALYLQNSTDPESSTLIPSSEGELENTTLWNNKKCFYTMGNHYWYNTSLDMDCDALFPAFLLYNDGVLNAFGWALMTDVEADNYEHPPAISFGRFFNTVPNCLQEIGTVTTQHIYLTDSVTKNRC